MTALRTVNYYPAAQPGPVMWSEFDPGTIGRDMLVAKAFGFQALRIFLPVSGAKGADTFDLPQPTAGQLARLTAVSDLARTVGVKLHLSLFDLWGSYGWLDQCETWTAAVAGAVDPTVVTVVELQNETPFATNPNAGPWAKAMLPILRRHFPGLPVSVSCNGLPETHLTAARAALGTLPSFYDWHVYPSTCPDEQTLDRAVAVVKPRSLRVGEFGCPSVTADGRASEAGQAGWLTAARTVLEQRRIVPAPWCLYDYTGWTGQAASYGLLATDGRIKPAGRLFL